ncbi:MAG: starch-binding protein [Ruminococcus sp.]|nr:starch-binding protein [Ruminococcus sp.]
MKLTRKPLSLFLAVLMLISCFSIISFTVSAKKGDTIYLKNSAGWSNPNCYMWIKNTETNNNAWPGIAMTSLGDNVYSYTVPSDDFNMIIFNGSGGSPQTDDMSYPGGGQIYDNSTGQWSVYDTSTIQPVISVSKKSGNYKSDTLTVTVTTQYADSASYSIDGGAAVSFSGSANVTIGAGLPIGSVTTLKVTATNANGTSTETYTYTKADPSQVSDGSTSPALGGYYGTNPNGGVGARKTISVDGNKSDWDSSMLVAQGVANDDPRVYCHWSMHEIPLDDYALYAAWDDNNLYLMYEMANVQDIVAPQDDFPLSQGALSIYNLPVFIYLNTGDGEGHGKTSYGTLWDSGITLDSNVSHAIAFSTNNSNGPFIYESDSSGLLQEKYAGTSTGVTLKYGTGKTLSGKLYGINAAGTDQGRVVGDTLEESSKWVDFYQLGHKESLDMFYEVSVPLKNLGISASEIESYGLGVMKVSTFGTSGMDCLPYDLSMQDNAAKEYSKDPSSSMEKEDEDHITVPMARVGKLLGGSNNPTTPNPTSSATTAPTTVAPTTAAPTTTETTQSTQQTTVTNPQTSETTMPTSRPDVAIPSSETASSEYTTSTNPQQTTNPSTGDTTSPTSTTLPAVTEPQESPTAPNNTTASTDPQETTGSTNPSTTNPDVTDPTNTDPTESATNQPTTNPPKKTYTVSSSFKMKAGESTSIMASGKGVKYSSSNKKIVKVNSKGDVTALVKGSATITVKAGDTTYKYKITVTSNPKLSKSKVTVKKGRTVTVTIKGKASGVNNKYKNTKYAKISAKKSAKKLKIKGKKKGSTTLYVTVNGKKLKLKVKVK